MMAQREYEQSSRMSEKPLQETKGYNHATDPVYNNVGHAGLWHKNNRNFSDMENNYGAFAYTRENAMSQAYCDEEMVM